MSYCIHISCCLLNCNMLWSATNDYGCGAIPNKYIIIIIHVRHFSQQNQSLVCVGPIKWNVTVKGQSGGRAKSKNITLDPIRFSQGSWRDVHLTLFSLCIFLNIIKRDRQLHVMTFLQLPTWITNWQYFARSSLAASSSRPHQQLAVRSLRYHAEKHKIQL